MVLSGLLSSNVAPFPFEGRPPLCMYADWTRSPSLYGGEAACAGQRPELPDGSRSPSYGGVTARAGERPPELLDGAPQVRVPDFSDRSASFTPPPSLRSCLSMRECYPHCH